jgi:hypothetical protein
MRHAIDPKIDCVFKALLGTEENRNLLIHFLNAFLAQELTEPIVWVEILNPTMKRSFSVINSASWMSKPKMGRNEELALQEKQSALLEKEAALAEIERLKTLLAKKD